MERLLYISESAIEDARTQAVVDDIVAGSILRNAENALTGALMFTGTHFAQILEASPAAIDRLMANLRNDKRHNNVLVVDRSTISARKFADWKMAYFGPSQFVSRHVFGILNATTIAERRRASEWLTDLAVEFSLSPTEK